MTNVERIVDAARELSDEEKRQAADRIFLLIGRPPMTRSAVGEANDGENKNETGESDEKEDE